MRMTTCMSYNTGRTSVQQLRGVTIAEAVGQKEMKEKGERNGN